MAYRTKKDETRIEKHKLKKPNNISLTGGGQILEIERKFFAENTHAIF